MKHVCIFCNKVLKTYQNLESHIRGHTGEEPFECEICGKSFKDHSNYAKHKNKHLNKQIPCDECSHSFSNKTLLRNHKKLKNRYPFQSDKCCCSFQHNYKLKLHRNKFHSTTASLIDSEAPTMDGVPATQDVDLMEEVEVFPSQMEATQMPTTRNTFKIHTTVTGTTKTLAKRTRNAEHEAGTKKRKDVTCEQTLTSNLEGRVVNECRETQAVQEDQQDTSDEDNDYIDHFAEQDEDTIIPPTPPIAATENYMSWALNDRDLILQNQIGTDSRQDLSITDGYDDKVFTMFILASWQITSIAASYAKFLQVLTQKDDNFRKTLTKLLCSDAKETVSIQEMNKFLHQQPHRHVGKFITWMIILDFVTRLSLFDSQSFLKTNDNAEFSSLIKNISHLLVQRMLRKFHSKYINYQDIPADYKDNILLKDYFESDILAGKEDEVQLEEESRIKDKIMMALMDAIFYDLSLINDGTNSTLLDNSCTFIQRTKIWQTLVHEYMDQLMNGNRASLFQTLLQVLLNENVNVQVCFHVLNNGQSKPVMLHKQVLERFMDSDDFDDKIVLNATTDELQIFKKMVYQTFCPDDYIGKITYQLFLMAQKLKFNKICYFLFRGVSCEYFVRQENKLDMFRILISLKMKEQLDKLASVFTIWFDKEAIFKCLNGLPVEDVLFFLGNKALNAEAITIYRILVQWSHDKCGLECINELEAMMTDDTLTQFKNVRAVLPLMELESALPQLVLQGFISSEDVSLVKAMRLSRRGFKCRLAAAPWFSTEERQK